MTEQPGGLPPQHQPHPIPEGMSWIVGSAPGLIFVQVFDATGTKRWHLCPTKEA